MGAKEKDQIKLLILLIVIVFATLLIMFIAMNISNLGIYFGGNGQSSNVQKNYKETSIITKIDTSGKTSTVGTIIDVIIEQQRLIHVSGTSILTSKVKNNGTAKDNLRFKVKFIAYDDGIILELIGYVGKIKTNETKYIDSYITKNLSNLKNVTYEVIQ